MTKNKSQWNEDEIKQLIQELPKIEDSRPKEEIWASIERKRHKRKAFWLIPAITSVVAVIFFISVIQLPTNDHLSESTEFSHDLAIEGKESVEEKAPLTIEEDVQRNTTEFKDTNRIFQEESHVIYAKPSTQIVTIGFLESSENYVIPVSFIGNGVEPAPVQIQSILKNFNNHKYGLKTNKLESIEMIVTDEQNKKVQLNLGENNFDLLKNDQEMFNRVIQETFRWQSYNKIYITANENTEIEMPINKLLKKAYFVLEPQIEGKSFLVPSKQTYNTIEEALSAMKHGVESKSLSPTILNDVEIKDIVKNNGTLTIEFQKSLETSSPKSALIMLEAILLTAKEFGYEYVQFEGMNDEKIGYLDLSKPVEVPYSPNPITVFSSS